MYEAFDLPHLDQFKASQIMCMQMVDLDLIVSLVEIKSENNKLNLQLAQTTNEFKQTVHAQIMSNSVLHYACTVKHNSMIKAD